MKKLITLFCFTLFSIQSFAQAVDLSDLVDKCSPAIFKITTYDASGANDAVGTGFFISSSGTALSNYHVFEGASRAEIKTGNNKTYQVDKILSWSKDSDMIQFTVRNQENELFPFLKISAAAPKLGERIFIIGNPLGLEKTVTDGIVSNIHHDEKMGETIQFSAPISKGNSGSPLMNMKGEALGIVTYYLENGQNLNFAVNINNLKFLTPVNALKFPPDETTIDVTNNSKNSSGDASPNNESNNASYYNNSSVKFCTTLTTNEQPADAGEVFGIDKKTGSNMYVWVGNNGKPLSTKQIIIEIYKKKNKHKSTFDILVDNQNLTIAPAWPDTHFKYHFTEDGYYLFKIYTKDNIPIHEGYVTIKYN